MYIVISMAMVVGRLSYASGETTMCLFYGYVYLYKL